MSRCSTQAEAAPLCGYRSSVLVEALVSAAHEVAEHRSCVGINAVIVAVDEVVGDQAYEALGERTARADGGRVEVCLCEALAFERGGDSQGALVRLPGITVAWLKELLVEAPLNGGRVPTPGR